MANKGRNYFFNSLAAKIDGTSVCSYASGTLAADSFKIFEAKSLALSAGAHVLLFQCFDPQSVYVNGLLPATVIDRVTLAPAAGGSLPSGTAVNITAAGASYVQGRTSQTIGSLAGVAGSMVSNNGVLTVGGSNTNTTFAGGISGAGSLVKAGSGTLTLSGVNTYTGATAVVAGTLEICASNTLSTNTTLEIATGATVKLSNAGEQPVAALTLNGLPQYRGSWGASGSGADHQRAQFTGTGVLRVLTGAVAPGAMIRIL
jgi:autotransporter-associated beta strand protein